MAEIKYLGPLEEDKGIKYLGALDEEEKKKDELKSEFESYPFYEKARIGMGKGMMDVAQGIKQKALQAGDLFGLISPDTAEEYTKRIQGEKDIYKSYAEDSGWAKAGEIAGQTVPFMALPGGVAGGAIRRMGTGALAGGTMGALQFTPEGKSSLSNILAGTVGGGIGAGIMTGLGKAINIATGKVPSKIAPIKKLSEEFDIPLTAGEMKQNPVIKGWEVFLENIPVIGMGKFREKQAGRALGAATGITGRYKGRIEDVGEAIHGALQRTLQKNKGIVNKSYDVVENIASTQKVGNIAPTQTKQIVKNLLDDYPDLFERLRDRKVEQILGTIQNDMPMELSFKDARSLRSLLGNYIGRAKQSAGAVGNDEVRRLSMAFDALNKDLDNWALNNSNKALYTAYKNANQKYKDLIVPFKDTLVNRATGQNYDTDIIFQNFIKPDRAKLAGKLIANVDLEGKQAIKYGIVKNAFDKANIEKSGKQIFSTQTFATNLKKLGETNKVVFTPREHQELIGLANIMQTAQRAGQYMENPPTGYRMLTSGFTLMGGGAIAGFAGGPTGLGVMTSGTALFTFLTTTNAGRRILLAASKLESGSPKIAMLIKQAYNQIPKIGASMAMEAIE